MGKSQWQLFQPKAPQRLAKMGVQIHTIWAHYITQPDKIKTEIAFRLPAKKN